MRLRVEKTGGHGEEPRAMRQSLCSAEDCFAEFIPYTDTGLTMAY